MPPRGRPPLRPLSLASPRRLPRPSSASPARPTTARPPSPRSRTLMRTPHRCSCWATPSAPPSSTARSARRAVPMAVAPQPPRCRASSASAPTATLTRPRPLTPSPPPPSGQPPPAASVQRQWRRHTCEHSSHSTPPWPRRPAAHLCSPRASPMTCGSCSVTACYRARQARCGRWRSATCWPAVPPPSPLWALLQPLQQCRLPGGLC
mmetsp:Transcript_8078/g.23162  ORF Transcript_8078/g.23162 Transcript_8078/m.23162 type:complete len:207 (+) Transcript_8078:2408-3028(+)